MRRIELLIHTGTQTSLDVVMLKPEENTPQRDLSTYNFRKRKAIRRTAGIYSAMCILLGEEKDLKSVSQVLTLGNLKCCKFKRMGKSGMECQIGQKNQTALRICEVTVERGRVEGPAQGALEMSGDSKNRCMFHVKGSHSLDNVSVVLGWNRLL